MKYKFELWKYNEFEYGEAEQHLNEMASKGWELLSADSEYDQLAVYRKSQSETPYTYAVDGISKFDEHYADFYRDAGWYSVTDLGNGMHVFATKKKTIPTLHTEDELKYQHILEIIEENHVSASLVASYLKLAAWTVLSILLITHDYVEYAGVPLSLILFGTWILPSLEYALNLTFTKIALKKAQQDERYERSLLMRGINRFIRIWRIIVWSCLDVWWLIYIADMIYQIYFILFWIASIIIMIAGIWIKDVRLKTEGGAAILILGQCCNIGIILFTIVYKG